MSLGHSLSVLLETLSFFGNKADAAAQQRWFGFSQPSQSWTVFCLTLHRLHEYSDEYISTPSTSIEILDLNYSCHWRKQITCIYGRVVFFLIKLICYTFLSVFNFEINKNIFHKLQERLKTRISFFFFFFGWYLCKIWVSYILRTRLNSWIKVMSTSLLGIYLFPVNLSVQVLDVILWQACVFGSAYLRRLHCV